MEDLKKYREMVETTVDMERVKSYEYYIRAQFDQNLQSTFTLGCEWKYFEEIFPRK